MAASEIVSDLRLSFRSGATKYMEWRRQQLRALLALMEENKDLFIEALRNDLYKHPFESLMMEIDFVCNEIISALNNLASWMAPEKVNKGLVNLADDCFIKKEPLGVVLIISPWNYPVQLLFSPMVGALAAGNCIVLKPSDLAPNTSELIETLIPKYMDSECIRVYPGGTEEASELLEQRFDHIFFTGNPNNGRAVMAAAAANLTPVTLELGGKCPVYVDSNCNLEVVAQRIIWGKLLNAGQSCVAPDYVMCGYDIQEHLFEKMKIAVQKFYGDRTGDSECYGRIVNDQHHQRLKSLLSRQKATYGGLVDDSQRMISPAIVIDVKPGDPLMEEEIFGPILPLVPVNGPEEAVEIINNREKPLTLYIFSHNKRLVQHFLSETSSGGVCINDTMTHVALESLPFGGVGESGMGHYHGKFSFDTFSHHRSVMWKSLALESVNSIRYPPYTEKNLRKLQWLMKKTLKRGGVLSFLPFIILGVFLLICSLDADSYF